MILEKTPTQQLTRSREIRATQAGFTVLEALRQGNDAWLWRTDSPCVESLLTEELELIERRLLELQE